MSKGLITMMATAVLLFFFLIFLIWDTSVHGEERTRGAAERALPPNAQNFVYEKPGWYSFTLNGKKFEMQQVSQERGYNYQFIEVDE